MCGSFFSFYVNCSFCGFLWRFVCLWEGLAALLGLRRAWKFCGEHAEPAASSRGAQFLFGAPYVPPVKTQPVPLSDTRSLSPVSFGCYSIVLVASFIRWFSCLRYEKARSRSSYLSLPGGSVRWRPQLALLTTAVSDLFRSPKTKLNNFM